MRKLIIKKYISFDPVPKKFYRIIEETSNGLYFNWQGIFSTIEGAKKEIENEKDNKFEIRIED